MATTSNTTSLSSFEIKSANLPLINVLIRNPDISTIQQDFERRFGDTPDFFDQDLAIIDFSLLQHVEFEHQIDISALIHVLKQYQLIPIVFRGGNPHQTHQAIACGLIIAPDITVQKENLIKNNPAKKPLEETVSSAQSGALIIDKPLRSGQRVYARGCDMVIMSMVNPGAEVIADGSIHVYAPLRGRVIAGARGNTEARIFALNMAPELISIAGVYRTSEIPLPSSVLGKPAQIRLIPGADGDKLLIDPLPLA